MAYITKDSVQKCLDDLSGENLIGNENDTFISLAEAKDRIEELPTADVAPRSEWISVKERLPEASIEVLVTVKIGDRVSVDTDRIYGGKWFNYGKLGHALERGYVTHWMPFPEAPKMKDVTNERDTEAPTTANELKPCPFCGGKAELLEVQKPLAEVPRFFVTCTVCGAEMPRIARSRTEATKVWDRRAEQ